MIEALRHEVASVKKDMIRVSQTKERGDEEMKTRTEFAEGANVNLNLTTEAELRRLRRLCKQQSEQLRTQDDAIRQLRQEK